MYTISKRLYSWLPQEEIEPKALNQLFAMAKMDSIIPNWIAVMPDCHMGKGACVGSVIPTQGAIIPAAVGVN